MNKKQKKHFNILTLKDKTLFFQQFDEHQLNFCIWRKNNCEENVSIQVDSFDILTSRLYFKNASLPAFDEKYLGKMIFMKGVLTRVNYFGYCKLLWSKNKEMFYIKTTSRFFKCDIRKNIRYKIEKKGNSKIKVNGFYMDLYDLSIGGATFYNPHKMISEVRGDSLSGITLLVGDEAFKIPKGEVVRRVVVEDSHRRSSFLLAVKFLDLKESVATNIYKKINSLIFLHEKKSKK